MDFGNFELIDEPKVNLKTKEECFNILEKNYQNPGHPIAFGGINTIYNYFGGVLNINEIKNFLSKSENYTLHREYHKSQRNISYSHFKRYQFQMDLVDIQNISKFNDGFKYLLTVIDTFTRYAFCKALKDKKGSTVLEAFKTILDEAKEKPLTLSFDRGAEFINLSFQNFCKDENMKYFTPDSASHGAYIERFNRTFQNICYKYMTENETNKFVDKIDDLLKTYNSRIHRMIGISPEQAEKDPSTHIFIRKKMGLYHMKVKRKKPKLKVGDFVRIAKIKGKFSRGYKEQSNLEIFKIYHINEKMPIPLYHLENYSGTEKIKGGFYEFELTKSDSEVFRIEKVIRKRKKNGIKELYVKWKGFDSSFNSWIPESNVVQDF